MAPRSRCNADNSQVIREISKFPSKTRRITTTTTIIIIIIIKWLNFPGQQKVNFCMATQLLEDFGEFKRKLRRLPEWLLEEEDKTMLRKRFRVVFVGGVGVGKTGLLERVIGVESLRLPKGPNCVTRRPVIIRYSSRRKDNDNNDENGVEDCVFKYHDDTGNAMDSKNKMNVNKDTNTTTLKDRVNIMTNVPIVISNSNSNSNNEMEYFEFIDLPGLTGMSRPGQSEAYPEHTKTIIKQYAQSADVLLLGLPADSDVVNNATLQLVKTWQLEERVVGFVSKLDLLEDGAGSGGVFGEQLGEVTRGFAQVVGVRNAPLLEATEPISLTNAREDEFFCSRHCEFDGLFLVGIEQIRAAIYGLLRRQFQSQCNSIVSRLFLHRLRLSERLCQLKDPSLPHKAMLEFTDSMQRGLDTFNVNRTIGDFLQTTSLDALFAEIDDVDVLIRNSQVSLLFIIARVLCPVGIGT
jgi:hypothetical protein